MAVLEGMETALSSIVGTLGGGSGVDMVKLAADLSAARFAPAIAQLEARNEELQTRISAASDLRNQLSQLSSALGDRMRNGDLAPAARLTNPSIADVSVLPGANPSGTYSLEVTQLADAQTLVMPAYGSREDLVGEGTLTLRFGTVAGGGFTADAEREAIDIAIAPDDTLADVARKINDTGSGVTAYVAEGTNGAQLVLKGEQGDANGFVLEAAPSGGASGAPGSLDYLGWNPASDTGQQRSTAQDAIFRFDTIEMRSQSNTVSDLPGGLSAELTSTNIGAPATISFASRNDAIGAVMGDLVAALNDITANLRDVANPLGGELGRDAGARGLKRALSGLTSEVIMPNAAPGEPSRLSDLGVSINRDGSFSFDSARLNESLAENPTATAAMFTTGLFGIFATVDDISRSMGAPGDPGSLAGSVARYTQQVERNDERLARVTEQQDKLRETMTSQFIAADRNVSASQSTLDFIRSQIEIWNSTNN
ncbi:flagellar filament capping protein FliD [Erythrobacter sp. HA6-11]